MDVRCPSVERSVNKVKRRTTREDPEASTTDGSSVAQTSTFTNYEETLQVCKLKTTRQRGEDLCLNNKQNKTNKKTKKTNKTLKKINQFKDFNLLPPLREKNESQTFYNLEHVERFLIY